MELRKLKSFLVVAKELHFGKAAEKLNISQPGLTNQIQQLESELGFELFDKEKKNNNRKVELTETGAYLMKEVSRVIELLDRTLKSAKVKSEKGKQLKFGILKISLTNDVVIILQKLQEKFPDTTFKIVEFNTAMKMQEALFKGSLDIGITNLPLIFKSIDYQVLNTEYLNVIMPKNHPLAKYKKIKIEQLRNDRWVEFSKEICPTILEEVEVYCRNVGFSREANIVQEVTNPELLMGLVNAGIGLAIYPSFYSNGYDGIVSKELTFYDGTQLELTKVLAFKDTLDEEYQQKIKNDRVIKL